MVSSAVQTEKSYCFENVTGSCIRITYSLTVQGILYGFLVLGTMVTIGGNLMVIISITHFKQLHSPTNILLASLATADFLLGLTVLPFSSVRSVDSCWYFGDEFCQFHSCLDTAFGIASISHLFLISIDRYCAIIHPLIYQTKFTFTVAIFLISFIWITAVGFPFCLVYSKANIEGLEEQVLAVSCIGNCQPLFNEKWRIISFVAFFLAFFVMVGNYAKIFLVAKKQLKMIENISVKSDKKHERHFKVTKRERKAAKTLGIAVGAFVVCWLPFFIDVVIDTFCNYITPSHVFDALLWITYFKSALNPLIYSFFYPWFRKALGLILTCKIARSDCATINLYLE
ncbi:trace amine-associated receptor 9-like [Protopterus annectens]|uniref:trace amine-associated receptor 9-like n=1 Tax=Protopterus annectens TaxID=7888 RepID=UPI001CFC198E|nr:trace amine-associated receptor 9-like [Protopterus annectens]